MGVAINTGGGRREDTSTRMALHTTGEVRMEDTSTRMALNNMREGSRGKALDSTGGWRTGDRTQEWHWIRKREQGMGYMRHETWITTKEGIVSLLFSIISTLTEENLLI
jgi:hypothetical protein